MLMVVHADATVGFYAHCQELYVFPGQRVRRGQLVGLVGHTGLARGPHLHFEMRVEGRPRNPIERFSREDRRLAKTARSRR
jgi:murein DD-endopeptidase MepM/ murein hydrolase activator NlpD